MNELTIFEAQLKPLVPRFAGALAGAMPVDRLIQTLVISCERTPALLECNRQSLLNAAMTFAVLGLEVDGVTGQGYIPAFNDRRRGHKVAQAVIGYRGLNTLGARSGITISGGVVRDGDQFEHREGSQPYIYHCRKLGGEGGRRIIAAWATANSKDRPSTVKVLSIDELMAVKAKSPRGNEPPWADPAIGFPAMCEKTAKRRLARDMPLNVFQSAARMEEAFEEQGEPAWISPDKGVVVEGVIAPPELAATPTAADLIGAFPGDLTQSEAIAASDARLGAAAACGLSRLQDVWGKLPREHQAALKTALDMRHKPAAANASIRRPPHEAQ